MGEFTYIIILYNLVTGECANQLYEHKLHISLVLKRASIFCKFQEIFLINGKSFVIQTDYKL